MSERTHRVAEEQPYPDYLVYEVVEDGVVVHSFRVPHSPLPWVEDTDEPDPIDRKVDGR